MERKIQMDTAAYSTGVQAVFSTRNRSSSHIKDCGSTSITNAVAPHF